MHSRKSSHRTAGKVALLCASSAIALSTAANAQSASGGVETVVVTGSLVITDVANSPTPLTVVSAAQLEATTPLSINDALAKLPVFLGNVAEGIGGASSLNLRNFGAIRTLILFDGHRVAPSVLGGTTNPDTLPQMLISRVDVVTGGASATYGSDAVSGVVNYVLDKNYDGLKYDLNAGISNYTDAAEFSGGLAWGTDMFGGRGHFEGNVKYLHQDKVDYGARPYGNNGQAWFIGGVGTAASPYVSYPYGRLINQADNGGVVNCVTNNVACAANWTTFGPNGVLIPFYQGTFVGTPGTNNSGDGGGYYENSTFSSGTRTAEFFSRFSYNIDDTTNASIELRATEAGNIADSNVDTINPGPGRGSTISTSNAYLPAATQALLKQNNLASTFTFGIFFDYVGGTLASRNGDMFRAQNLMLDRNVSLDLDGTWMNKYNWDVYYQHDIARNETTVQHGDNVERFLAGEDAVINSSGNISCYVSTTTYSYLYPNCVPIDVFGQVMTTDMYNYFQDREFYVITNTMDDYGGSIGGAVFDLPAGPVRLGLSAEGRQLDFNAESPFDPAHLVQCTGLRFCIPSVAALYDQSTVKATHAALSVYEGAAEVAIPLLKDLPLIQEASIDIAGRYTDYSTTGVAETWKVGFDYHVDDMIRFRGTSSFDIRAPNLYELHQSLTTNTGGFQDILTGGNFSLTHNTTGNPNLKPEVAHTNTVGVVLTPDFVPGLTFSVDYFKINMSNAITSLTGSTASIQQICNASGGTSPYCSLIIRPFAYTNTTLANYPTLYLTENVNSAKQYTEGTDIEADYGFDMGDVMEGLPGHVDLRNLATIQPYINNVNYPGSPLNLASYAKGRDAGFIDYTWGTYGIHLQNTWYSGFNKQTLLTQVYAQPHANSFDTLDVTVDKSFTIDDNPVKAYFSVQNIGNTNPPLDPTATTNPGVGYPGAPGEKAMGRYYTLGVKGSF